MDRRPIGVFDSGLGGLTAARELIRLLPGEDIIYFGDTGRVPYGSRSRETIIQYARQDVAFLRTFDLKAVVIACGTVSSAALDLLKEENPIPIIGVVGPAVSEALQATHSRNFGLIGTQATIRAGAYEKKIRETFPDAAITAVACPLLVPLVENGRFRPGDSVVETVVGEYLAPMKAAGVDTLVLGCTHYPLLTDVIHACMGEDVALVNSGAACARHVRDLLTEMHTLADGTRQGTRRYYVSDRVEGFSDLASVFLGEDVHGGVEQVDITRY